MAIYKSDNTASDVSAKSPHATNYIDLWEKLIQICDDSNQHVDTFAVASGGTSGYVVGDILQLADGGATEAFPSEHSGNRATFEVTSVSTGQVTGVRVRNSGLYSTLPTDNGTPGEFNTTVLSGVGTGTVTLTITFASQGWTIERRTQEVASVAVGDAAGSGYSISDKVDPVGGDTRTGYDSPQATNIARFNVDSVSVGAVTGLSIDSAGVYHRTPGTDEVATVTTGSGDNTLTVDLTFQDYTGAETELEVILSSGTTVVGIRTFTDDVSYFNWEIAGIPSYNAAADFDGQTNISAGRFPDDDRGQYVVLTNTIIDYWFNVDDRRIIGVFLLDGGRYATMYLGLLNPFGTSTEYPLPLYVAGCTSDRETNKDTGLGFWAGPPCGMIAFSISDLYGPGAIHGPGGSWYRVRNASGSTTPNGEVDEVHTWPGGFHDSDDTNLPDEDRIIDAPANANDWKAYGSVDPTDITDTMLPARDGSGNDLPTLFEVLVVGIEQAGGPIDPIIFGQIDDMCWVSQTLTAGSLSAEDEIVDASSNLYIVFNTARLSGQQHYFALRWT